MPLNPLNFDDTPFTMSDYTDSILKGYNAYLQPQKFRQEVEQTGLQNEQLGLTNQGLQAELPFKAPQAGANVQLTQQQAKQIATNNFMNQIKSQFLREREEAEVGKLKQENEMYSAIKESEIAKNRRQGMTEFSKSLQNERDIRNGFEPDTNGQVVITPERQKTLLRQLELKKILDASDPRAREKLENAVNIDKTLESFDPKKLAEYAGGIGAIAKKFNQGRALIGAESKKYQQYQEELTKVDLFAHQVRQFYKDSISESAKKDLHDLTQPATWANSPAIALKKFEALKKLLLSETQTYKDIIPNSGVYINNSSRGPTNEMYGTDEWEFE